MSADADRIRNTTGCDELWPTQERIASAHDAAVRIQLVGCWAYVDPRFQPLITPLLEFKKRRWSADDKLGVLSAVGIERCWDIVEVDDVPDTAPCAKRQIRFARGFVTRVRLGLQRDGKAVEIIDPDQAIRSKVCEKLLAPRVEGSKWRQRIIEALENDILVRIVCNTIHQQTQAITAILELFPLDRCLMTVSTKSLARKFARRLSGSLGYRVTAQNREAGDRPDQVFIGPLGIRAGLSNLWPVVVFPEVAAATASEVIASTGDYFSDVPRFAVFLASDASDEWQELQLERLFGPVAIDMRLRPPKMIPIQGPPDCSRGGGGSLCKKRRIWSSETRNVFLANVAIAALPPSTSPRDEPLGLVPTASRPRDVVLVVESTEHAQQLGRFLPDWPVYCLCRTPLQAPRRTGSIATLAAFNSGEVPAKFVIWAAGAQSNVLAAASTRAGPWRSIRTIVMCSIETASRDVTPARTERATSSMRCVCPFPKTCPLASIKSAE